MAIPKGMFAGSKHPLARLTEEIVEDARIWYYDDPVEVTVAELAEYYGVNETTMSNALRGVSWRHVKQAKGAQGRTKYASKAGDETPPGQTESGEGTRRT